MDDIERAAIAAEGYDPDDPAVVAALARASAVLAELGSGLPLRYAWRGYCAPVRLSAGRGGRRCCTSRHQAGRRRAPRPRPPSPDREATGLTSPRADRGCRSLTRGPGSSRGQVQRHHTERTEYRSGITGLTMVAVHSRCSHFMTSDSHPVCGKSIPRRATFRRPDPPLAHRQLPTGSINGIAGARGRYSPCASLINSARE
jgi:hypothetical protein